MTTATEQGQMTAMPCLGAVNRLQPGTVKLGRLFPNGFLFCVQDRQRSDTSQDFGVMANSPLIGYRSWCLHYTRVDYEICSVFAFAISSYSELEENYSSHFTPSLYIDYRIGCAILQPLCSFLIFGGHWRW